MGVSNRMNEICHIVINVHKSQLSLFESVFIVKEILIKWNSIIII